MHGRARVDPASVPAEEQAALQVKIARYSGLVSRLFALKKDGDRSPATLVLCAKILAINPDFYSLWNFRREILDALADTQSPEERVQALKTELSVSEAGLYFNPKSYCAWHHRVWAIEAWSSQVAQASDLDVLWPKAELLAAELAQCTKFLALDSRNFHCWDYRRFVAREAQTPVKAELRLSTDLIVEDYSNYSAWHYRTTLLPLRFLEARKSPDKVRKALRKELEWVWQALNMSPDDQSGWLYYRWLMSALTAGVGFGSALAATGWQRLHVSSDFDEGLLREQLARVHELVDEADCSVWPLRATLWLHQALRAGGKPADDFEAQVSASLARLSAMDPARAGYYRWLRRKLLAPRGAAAAAAAAETVEADS